MKIFFRYFVKIRLKLLDALRGYGSIEWQVKACRSGEIGRRTGLKIPR